MKTKSFLFLFCLLGLFIKAEAKIRLITFHYNMPEFVEMQYKALKKFMLDDYELIVFNDAKNPEYEEQIRAVCEKYGIMCVRYQQQWHEADPLNDQIYQQLYDPSFIHSHLKFSTNEIKGIAQQPSVRHCHVIQYALDHFGYDHNDIVAIMDGDIFPIRPIHLRSLLKDCDIMGTYQIYPEYNVDYLWVPFIAFNMRKLPNKRDLKFHVDVINGYLFDTGAHTYHYLKNNPNVRVKKYGVHSSTSFYEMPISEMKKHGFIDKEIDLTKNLPWPLCVEFHIEHRLLHFGASSFVKDGHATKAEYVLNFLEDLISK